MAIATTLILLGFSGKVYLITTLFNENHSITKGIPSVPNLAYYIPNTILSYIFFYKMLGQMPHTMSYILHILAFLSFHMSPQYCLSKVQVNQLARSFFIIPGYVKKPDHCFLFSCYNMTSKHDHLLQIKSTLLFHPVTKFYFALSLFFFFPFFFLENNRIHPEVGSSQSF